MLSIRTEDRTVSIAAMAVAVGAILGCSADRLDTHRIDFETSEGTKLAFDLSPDGNTIVFDLLGQLWLLPAEGGRAVPITDAVRDTSEDRDPAFVADGSSIVFRAERPGGAGLFRLSLADTTVYRLTDEPRRVSISPDARQLAFARGGAIQILDLAGSDPRELEIDSLPGPGASYPTWSPSGDRIVFVNAPPGRREGGSLWEVSPSGGVARALSDPGMRARSPAYSPDGRRLAFFALDSASQFQLWAMEPGARPVQLTSQEDVTPLRVRWFPDATRLLYHAGGRLWAIPATGGGPEEIPFTARLRLTKETLTPRLRFTPPGTDRAATGHMGLALSPGGTRIAMIALGQLWAFAAGSEPRAVAPMPPNATGLSWSPLEDAVVWSAGPGGAEDLYATDLTTGSTRQITALPGAETAPSWSPDGTRIAFIHFEKPALDTPPWDNSDAGAKLRVIPADASMLESAEATMDLGEGFTTWGFFGPQQEAPLWGPDSPLELLFFEGGSAALVSLTGDRREFRGTVPSSPLCPSVTDGASDCSVNPSWLNWTADHHLVYVEDGLLWRATFDRESAYLGEPIRLSDDAALYASVSRDGSILYVSQQGLRILRPTGSVEDLGWPLAYDTPTPDRLLIRDVRIVPGTGAAFEAPVDILTDRGRIVQIGPARTLPVDDEIRVVDAAGRPAIPGLIDLHTHLWDDAVLPGALYHGVTTIRDMGSSGIARLAGHRDAIEAGLRPGPRVVMGGVQFWGTGTTSGGGGYMVSGDSARARATALMAPFGTSYLKMRLFSDWPGAARLVRAAHAQGWPVSGHIAAPLPLVAAGIDGMEHLGPSGLRTNEIVYDDMVQLFRNGDIWIVPTVIAYSGVVRTLEDPTILDEPETNQLLTPFLRWWGLRLAPPAKDRYDRFTHFTRLSLRRFYEGGVSIGAGSDNPTLPWALHAELEELVTAGLSPLAAITAATGTAAEILGASSEIGTIEEGKWADLVILNADPLEDIRNTRDIWMVIKGGEVVDRADLAAQVRARPR